MATSRASDKESIRQENILAEPESPFQSDDSVAWEAADENLWIPYRIRGSWRGGVLG
ncbi:MAG: hypothetical protein JXA73_03610 [Acidobacteria bacterium]|nr:hypothetical protein [Acidobacteriota bacterium]